MNTAAPSKMRNDNLFEYYDCADWENVVKQKKERDQADSRKLWVTRESEASEKAQVVHLVFPDGTVQGTQLAHHLISAMICQNPVLFHANAMQSVLANILVHLLKEPIKSQGKILRQLDWVEKSYSRAYAQASCKAAIGEHKRFCIYLQNLMNSTRFGFSLISDALDHPRELKCPRLSKAVLGMWMCTRASNQLEQGKRITASLLNSWKLGLATELFHRLGITLEIQVVFLYIPFIACLC